MIARGTREGYETLVSNETTIQITARTATIRVHDSEKFFDESDPAFTGTEENLVKAGDLGTVTYRRTNADEAVGTYPEVLTADYMANSNYIVNVVNGDFEIRTASIKDAKLEAAGGSWIYDGAAHALSLIHIWNRKHRPQCRSQRHRHRKLMRQHRRRKCRNQIQKLPHRNQKHRHRNQRRQLQEMKPPP